jgi:excisionase family DNA binding protein
MTVFEEAVEQPLTPEDVAALLRIDRETVYRMARRGELPAFKVSRRWRFLPSHLQRWMEQQERGGR